MKILILLSVTMMLVGCVVPLVQPDTDRIEYIQVHQLDPDVAEAIRLGRVIAGMTREQVEACWGSPSSVDKSESIGLHLEWGREVWEYRSNSVFTLHPEATLTFRDGKVVDVSPAYLSDLTP